MIKGTINPKLEPIVELRLHNKNGETQLIEATVDTGFNGYLTLPLSIIEGLDCTRLGLGRAILADGSEGIFEIYEVVLEWDNQLKEVEVDIVNCNPLIGMALLENYQLQITVFVGGEVIIKPIL